MKLRKVISLICALVITITLFAGCSSKNTVKKNSFDKKIQSTELDDKFIAENDNFKLEFNEVTMGVVLTDKNTGKVYGTSPLEEGGIKYNDFGIPLKRHPQLESVLYIKYYNKKTNNANETAISQTAIMYEKEDDPYTKEGRVVFERIKNGVKVEYYFDGAEIMVPLTYTLRDEGLAITINTDEIQENDNMLLSVSLAPMFCSADNKKDGYLFYPSGSGALVYTKEISGQGESFSSEIYGVDASKEVWDKISTEKAVRLPVFGAKTEDQAVVGIIEKGAESAYMDMKVGSTSIGYSAVYPTFQVRGYTDNIKELYNNRYYEGQVYADQILSTPFTVCYYPLANEKANYNTMAEVYRDYLNKTEGKVTADSVSTLDITMVGGAMIQKSFLGIPYKDLYKTTTVTQAQNIMNDLNKKGVKVSNLNLTGFGQNGLDSNKLGGGFTVDSNLGNADQLKKLNNTLKKRGTNLYFDFDIVGFTQTANGYDSYFDAAIRANRKIAKLYNFDIAILGRETNNAYSILKRAKLSTAANDAFEAVKKLNVGGIGFSSLSSVSYSDYADKENTKYYAKSGMASQVSKIYELSGKNKVNILSSDANAYAAANSNLVLNIPTFSTGSYLFDVDIPFYAMVFRGRTAISGDSLNLATDSNLQLLRSIESGAGLAYTLTNNYSTQLLDSTSTVFYNSLYRDLKKQIVNNYNKVSDFYEKVGNSKIANHIIHENGLRETVFENGVKVYVNYLNQDLTTENGVVKAKSFLVGEASAQ